MADRSATITTSSIALEDAAVVRQVQEGNTGAFGRIVLKYQDRVLNVCWRVCGNIDDAQDLAQETFVHALQKIGSYRFEAGFYTWLFRIAVNLSLTHRRRSRRPTLSLHDGDGDAEWRQGGQPRSANDSATLEPLARLSTREMQERLIEGLDRLDDDFRAVVVLRDIEGLDYQEVAEVLGISLGTVKSRLHRARMALREMLRPTLDHDRR